MKTQVATHFETELTVGPSAIDAYSRLSYTMWHALAEFIDNATQATVNYKALIEPVLAQERKPLIVEIDHNRIKKELSIKDNSIGMTKDDLIAALRLAHPTKDSHGRSKYGMGMKTAACWIGRHWKIITCELGSGVEWTADVDVKQVAHHSAKIPVAPRNVDSKEHYTQIVISDLHRNIQKRTEETIKGYLGSMYRMDLLDGKLKIFYNGDEVKPPEDLQFDTDPEGLAMRRSLPPKTIGGKIITGWVAVLKKGGRKFGGFSLFQNRRQIQGFPNAWKPRLIFGGVDDEGANNLVAQRITGVIELDGFDVSHTKDAVLFADDEEDELEKFLKEETSDYCNYARRRRNTPTQPWSKEKVLSLLENMKEEFVSPEMGDAVNNAVLPPFETIVANNQKQIAGLTQAEKMTTFDVTRDFRVVVSLQEKSEYDPYVTISAGADAGTIHVIINNLHPYYAALETTDAADECLRQYMFDAIAEYRASRLTGRVNPNSVRRLKDALLRVGMTQVENAAAAAQEVDFEPDSMSVH